MQYFKLIKAKVGDAGETSKCTLDFASRPLHVVIANHMSHSHVWKRLSLS